MKPVAPARLEFLLKVQPWIPYVIIHVFNQWSWFLIKCSKWLTVNLADNQKNAVEIINKYMSLRAGLIKLHSIEFPDDFFFHTRDDFLTYYSKQIQTAFPILRFSWNYRLSSLSTRHRVFITYRIIWAYSFEDNILVQKQNIVIFF